MKTALGSPWASKVNVPVIAILDDPEYTPGTSVWPPRSGPTTVSGVRPAASRKAVVASFLASEATASVSSVTPVA